MRVRLGAGTRIGRNGWVGVSVPANGLLRGLLRGRPKYVRHPERWVQRRCDRDHVNEHDMRRHEAEMAGPAELAEFDKAVIRERIARHAADAQRAAAEQAAFRAERETRRS